MTSNKIWGWVLLSTGFILTFFQAIVAILIYADAAESGRPGANVVIAFMAPCVLMALAGVYLIRRSKRQD